MHVWCNCRCFRSCTVYLYATDISVSVKCGEMPRLFSVFKFGVLSCLPSHSSTIISWNEGDRSTRLYKSLFNIGFQTSDRRWLSKTPHRQPAPNNIHADRQYKLLAYHNYGIMCRRLLCLLWRETGNFHSFLHL